MAYVDFTYYADAVNGFGGTAILEPDFNKYERKARVFLDDITFNRLQLDNTLVTESVKNAICEIMESNYNLDKKELEIDGNIIASESVDGHSISYAIGDVEKNTLDRGQLNKVKYYNIAKEYLSNTGLLYRGL